MEIFDWTIQKDFILDGYPYEYPYNRSATEFLDVGIPLTANLLQGVTACVDNVRWNSFAVDPTVTMLFVQDPNQPPTSGKKVPIAAIIVPVLAAVLIVVIIIILFITVPSFRLMITPYQKRNMDVKDNEDIGRGTWSKGQKPTH